MMPLKLSKMPRFKALPSRPDTSREFHQRGLMAMEETIRVHRLSPARASRFRKLAKAYLKALSTRPKP